MCARVMSYSSVSLNALLVIALQNSDALSSISKAVKCVELVRPYVNMQTAAQQDRFCTFTGCF